MKTLFQSKNRSLFFNYAFLLGLFMFLSGVATAQAPVKGKNHKADKIPHATLKEAQIKASILTTAEEIGPMRVLLTVLNPTGKTVKIRIDNYGNEEVFRDAFEGREYRKILNFSPTLEGRYSLHVNGLKQEEVRRFTINSLNRRNLIASDLNTSQSSGVMAVIFKESPTKVKLHLANNSGTGATYTLRDENKVVINRGYVKKPQYTKIFDLDNLPKGKYTFEVNHQNNKTASRTFEVQNVNERSFVWTDKRYRPVNKPSVMYSVNQQNPAAVDFTPVAYIQNR